MSFVLEELGAWAETTQSIPADARRAARRVLMDQVGVSLGGGKELGPLARGEPSATLWASGERVLAPDAVLANRFAGDDLELTAGPEIGAAALAAAELADAALGDVYLGMAVAAELEHYLRGWLQLAVEEHGLHPPAVFGAVAACAASAKILKLSAPRFAGALAGALALTPQSPYAAFSEGATGKWLYGAWSQMLGLRTALWAREGMTGALSTLEGPRGVAQAFRHQVSSSVLGPPAFRPGRWAIRDVTFKAFRCSRACHPALTALSALEPIDRRSLERVDVWSYPFSVTLETRSTKSNAIANQMSISKTVSDALGGVPVAVHEEGSDDLPRVRTARVRLTTKSGATREASSEAKWSAAAPATDDELRDRFRSLTKGRRAMDPWPASDETPAREVCRG